MGTTRLIQRLTEQRFDDQNSMEENQNTFSNDGVSVISVDEVDSLQEAVFAQPLHDENIDSNICDACGYCDDVCEQSNCIACQSKSMPGSMLSSPCVSVNASTGHGDRFDRRSYTMCQIRRHNHKGSAWIVAGDSIYDATPYLTTHPGGVECLLRRAGGVQDCTRDLDFHSAHGKQMFKKCLIGKVRSCPRCSSHIIKSSEKQRWFLW
jgi:cytochrome b involved in lipid metabolism